MSQNNQLSRYGAIAKFVPFVTGKAFFLISSSEYSASTLPYTFPTDNDGVVRVYTTWASVISAVQATNDSAVVIVSPLFTTAPTLAQIDSLKAANCQTIQAGNSLPDGSYLATKASAAFATATTNDLFQVNGKVKLLNILGEPTTTIGTVTGGAKFLVLPNVGSSTDLCATGNVTALATGGQISITGTLATAMVASVQSAIVDQAAAVVVKSGKIQINFATTSTGTFRYSVVYKPLEPGAYVSPL